jgi:hypothetical protein
MLRARRQRVRGSAALCAVAALVLGACVSATSGEWTAQQTAQAENVEALIEAGDAAGARAAFALLAPRADQTGRAAALERRIGALELEPFEPSLLAANEALSAGDDELARAILSYARARRPAGAALATLERLDAVLVGRELLRFVRLELRARTVPGAERARVELVARNDGAAAVVLECSGASLDGLATALTTQGAEQRTAQRLTVDALDRLVLEPGREVRVPLGEFPAATRGCVAVRSTWKLTPAGTVARINGFEVPAQEVQALSNDWVLVDPRFPPGAITPQELADYVRRGAPSMAGLLERTVRVAPERRAEALDVLTPALLDRPLLEIARAAPVLRWLSGERLGDSFEPDGVALRAWLVERAARRAAPSVDEPLGLPQAASGARSGAGEANVDGR